MNKIDDIIVELFKETVINCDYDEAKGNEFAKGLLDEKMSDIPKKVKEYVRGGGKCNSFIISTYLIGLLNEKDITSYLVSTKDGFAVMYENDGKFLIANPTRDIKHFTEKNIPPVRRISYYFRDELALFIVDGHDDSKYELDKYSDKFGDIRVIGNMRSDSSKTLKNSIQTSKRRIVAPNDKANLDINNLKDIKNLRGFASFLNEYLRYTGYEAYVKDGRLYAYNLFYSNQRKAEKEEHSVELSIPENFFELPEFTIVINDECHNIVECNIKHKSEKKFKICLTRQTEKDEKISLTLTINDSKIDCVEMTSKNDTISREMKIEDVMSKGVRNLRMKFSHYERGKTRSVSLCEEGNNSLNYHNYAEVVEDLNSLYISAAKKDGIFEGCKKSVELIDPLDSESGLKPREDQKNDEQETLDDIKRIWTHPRSMNTIAYLLKYTNYYFPGIKDKIDVSFPNIKLPSIDIDAPKSSEYKPSKEFEDSYNRIICGRTNIRFPERGIALVDENKETNINDAIERAERCLGEEKMFSIRNAIRTAEILTKDMVSKGSARSYAYIDENAVENVTKAFSSYLNAVGSQYNLDHFRDYRDFCDGERMTIIEESFKRLFENGYANYIKYIEYNSSEILDGSFGRVIRNFIDRVRSAAMEADNKRIRDEYNAVGANCVNACDRINAKLDYIKDHMSNNKLNINLREIIYGEYCFVEPRIYEAIPQDNQTITSLSDEEKMLYYYMIAFEQMAKIDCFGVGNENGKLNAYLIPAKLEQNIDNRLWIGANAYKLASNIRERLGLADTRSENIPSAISFYSFDDTIRMILWLTIKCNQNVFGSYKFMDDSEMIINGEDIIELGRGAAVIPKDILDLQEKRKQQEQSQEQAKKTYDIE